MSYDELLSVLVGMQAVLVVLCCLVLIDELLLPVPYLVGAGVAGFVGAAAAAYAEGYLQTGL
jgi:hypothetical protein